ncbi:hypothetical protein IV49_GL000165 [Kandleria vitulina DSM 20405]|uniref:Uncharacterized protein n=1 Tax=Kandleria vitulina DSM 20405 TaxID=1410657 RepID=A0A0R2HEP8_9FIRM|nr:hypothetical protein [Kandleria vitulina]KRN51545.1 hypothetical protein IV49_GL000165 [Kandleria vitulina DSM 20405]MEE0988157.1 hypothetical protein [Kandleria vitulina]
MNKKVLFTIIIIVVIVTGVFVLGKQKMSLSEGVSEDITYKDEHKQYISSLTSTLDYSDKGTYTKSFKIKNGQEKSLLIAKNTLNKDFQLIVKNKKGNVLFSKTIKKKETLSLNKKYKSGDYVLNYKLPKDTKGTVEIQINE